LRSNAFGIGVSDVDGMEAGLAGWNLNLFKGKDPKKAKTPRAEARTAQTSTIVQPLIRGGQRGAADKDAMPRFQITAGDQLNTRSGDRFVGIRSKLRHAFTPSQPVADRRMFAGRDGVLKTVISSIESQRLHVVLYGERGIGKTSLLHMLTQAAHEARYIVVYSSCGANSTFDETFRAAAADIPLLFHSGFAPTTMEAEKGASLADLLPNEPVSPRKFGDLCTKLTGTRDLIILDEFDRCESGAFRRDVAELIKNLSDRLGRVQLVLAGVAADLTELVEHIPSIRRNIYALRVPKMTDAEVLQIVANGEREAGVTFDTHASAFVVAVASGSPYIASLLCHHAGHVALDQGRSTILAGDVSSAVGRAADEFQGRIGKPAQQHIRRLFEQGRGEAMAMAARASLHADGAFSAAEVRAVNEIDARKAQTAVDQLATDGLIVAVEEDEAGKRYAFIEEGLPTYLWITWAQQNLQPETPTKIRAAAAAAS
jgi:Cdc6-like AAA superfamily ATPase